MGLISVTVLIKLVFNGHFTFDHFLSELPRRVGSLSMQLFEHLRCSPLTSLLLLEHTDQVLDLRLTDNLRIRNFRFFVCNFIRLRHLCHRILQSLAVSACLGSADCVATPDQLA